MNRRISKEQVDVEDLPVMVMSLFTRMRRYHTFDEAHGLLHLAMQIAEQAIQDGTAWEDDEGNTVNIPTAEERIVLGRDSYELPDTAEGFDV
jgi:hypothetical protein